MDSTVFPLRLLDPKLHTCSTYIKSLITIFQLGGTQCSIYNPWLPPFNLGKSLPIYPAAAVGLFIGSFSHLDPQLTTNATPASAIAIANVTFSPSMNALTTRGIV